MRIQNKEEGVDVEERDSEMQEVGKLNPIEVNRLRKDCCDGAQPQLIWILTEMAQRTAHSGDV